MHDRSMTKQRHTFDFIGQLQIFWSQRGTKAPTDWEDSINPTKTLSLIRQTSIGHKIHSQTPQALATGARLAAHRQSTRDLYGESSHDKPSPTCTACGSTSRDHQVCHTEASWRCAPFTGDTRSSLSCSHVISSAHQASGYQLVAICHSWCGDINKLTFLEPCQQQRLTMYQDNHQATKTATCATPFLTARHSVSFVQGSSPQPTAWTGELPLTIRSGKREHHRTIITTEQPQ